MKTRKRRLIFVVGTCRTLLTLPCCSLAFPIVPTAPHRQSVAWASARCSTSTTLLFAKKQTAPNKRTQLKWVIQSLEHIVPTSTIVPTDDMITALQSLSHAPTPRHVAMAGQQLETILSTWQVQTEHDQQLVDRLIKACSMTGLHRLALQLVMQNKTLTHHETLPSPMAQDALMACLRRAGKFNSARTVMTRFLQVAQQTSSTISTVALNIYLAFAYDCLLKTKSVTDPLMTLQEMANMLALDKNPTTNHGVGAIPDVISYNTVMQAAAAMGNRTLVYSLWEDMQARSIQPTIVSYNARLQVVMTATGFSSSSGSPDDEIFAIYDEINESSCMKADRYTIDALLLPLIRANRMAELNALLDDFVANNSELVVSNTFVAFLLTLAQDDDMEAAEHVWKTYLLPALSPVISEKAGGVRWIRANQRHFNVMLAGYGRLWETNATPSVQSKAWKLYNDMIDCSHTHSALRPDAYTVTSMMNLCQTSSEIVRLLEQGQNHFGVSLRKNDAVVRAGLTAFGKVGDASSACVFYIQFSPNDTRHWNALLGAIACSTRLQPGEPMDLITALPVRPKDAKNRHGLQNSSIFHVFHGKAPKDAMEWIIMEYEKPSQASQLPAANSQTFCLIASVLQHNPPSNEAVLNIFRLALSLGIPADGRLLNAIIRCFGEDLRFALKAWTTELRPACIKHENRQRSRLPYSRKKGKNLLAAYYALLYVAGRALRPDIALRLVYAMQKEELEATETALNCYRSGKKERNGVKHEETTFRQKLQLIDPYESLLYIECMKYDRNDKRRTGEKRVRIIL